MNVRELSLNAPRAALTAPAPLSVSATSAQTAALGFTGDAVFVCDQDCNILFGSNPTATAACLFVPAKTMIRIAGIQAGEKMAVIAAAAGTAWLAPGA